MPEVPARGGEESDEVLTTPPAGNWAGGQLTPRDEENDDEPSVRLLH
jgi:hypothetical protein